MYLYRSMKREICLLLFITWSFISFDFQVVIY